MRNTTSTLIALVVAAILIFIVPLITLTGRSDNVTQQNVELIVEEFVTEIRNTGKLTRTTYQNFESQLNSTTGNNSYSIEIEVKHLDENPGKKTAQANYTKIGENVYYSEFTTQVLKQIGIQTDDETPSQSDTMILKQGDIVYVEVKNTNTTAAQTLKSSFIGFSNAGEYKIKATSSGMVTVNGIKD